MLLAVVEYDQGRRFFANTQLKCGRSSPEPPRTSGGGVPPPAAALRRHRRHHRHCRLVSVVEIIVGTNNCGGCQYQGFAPWTARGERLLPPNNLKRAEQRANDVRNGRSKNNVRSASWLPRKRPAPRAAHDVVVRAWWATAAPSTSWYAAATPTGASHTTPHDHALRIPTTDADN